MGTSHQFGKKGEDRAVAYLLRSGFVLLARNWRFRHYELDIVCRSKDLLVVVEVKARHETGLSPEDLLGFRKREHLRRAADAFVRSHGLDLEVRFDLILLTGPEMELTHIPDAVQPFE